MRENAVYRYLARFGQAVSETGPLIFEWPGLSIFRTHPLREILGAGFTILESPLLVPAAELGGALELAAASVKE